MSKHITYEEAIYRIAERTYDNTKELRKTRLQRRTEFTDLYGIPFMVQGDDNYDGEFYISISPDLVYFLRFQFKLQIHAFESTVKGINGGSLSIGSTSLENAPSVMSNTSTLESGIDPNPHSHTASSGASTPDYGIKKFTTGADDFAVTIDGIDVTDYLIEQHDGDWIEGEGLYPSNQLDGKEDFYDVLDVATMMYNEGREADAEKLLRPGFKKVVISSDTKFRATMYLYCKYSNMGR